MQRYDSYKDSGVKWLGEIPSHWEVKPIKRIAQTFAGATPNSNNEKYWGGSIAWVTPADFKTETKYVNGGKRFLTELGLNSCSTVIVPRDSVIFSKRAPVGQISIATQPLCTNQGCISCVPFDTVDSTFLYYLLSLYKETFESFSGGTTFKEISQQSFNDFSISLPPLIEQEAIANYLDTATSKIDEAIAQQQKMIDLLNERKQIIINNAVTKGLDPNVKMKPSGIDWIGDIPEHWKKRRMRYLCKITTGNKDTINRVDDGLYPFYVRSPKVERINSYSYDGEAVLMAGDGVGAGKVFHYVNGKFDYHQRVYCFYEIEMIKAKLLYYYMQNLFKYVIEQLSAKSTVDSVRLNMIQDFVVCIPSIKEQIEMVNFIDKEIANIEKAIQISLKQISLLQERKQIIINDVVTGKVKVI